MASDAIPPLSCDCHLHIFGPFDRFPLSEGRRYTPGEASLGEYRAIAEGLGLQRRVIVQASPYGTDNRATLDAVQALGPETTRAVAVVDETVTDATLQAMHAAGVRGLRFNLVSGNGAPEERMAALARRIAPLGWHLQLYGAGEKLYELGPLLATMPVQVVLDHCGGVRAEHGTGHAHFTGLRRLLDGGNAWVKLTSYRMSSAGEPWADMAEIVRELVKAVPERCVWGSDWPHSLIEGTPNIPGLLAQVLGWVPDPGLRQRILVDNPARLYGFA